MQSPGTSNPEQHLRAQLELLQDADNATHNRDDSPASGNSYEDLQLASQNAIRAIASKASGESHIHPDLREASPPHGQSTGMESSSHPPLAPAPPAMQALQAAAEQPKPKRELSQSKRAAQNRAAQRAFRQRKEGYIKKLEQQVRDFSEMEISYKQIQQENYALREYVVHLQSRLLDTQGEVPPPPPNVNLSHSQGQADHTMGDAGAVDSSIATPLEAVAQAVAGLAAQEELGEDRHSYMGLKSERIDEDPRELEAEKHASEA